MKLSTVPRQFTALNPVRRSLSAATFACCVAMLCVDTAHSAVSYSVIGSTYTQDFDSLPNSPTNASLGSSPAGWKDDDPNASGSNFSLEGWYLFHPTSVTEGGFNGNQRMRHGSGSSGTGAFYGFGANSSTDRAIGAVGASTLAPDGQNMYIGLRLTNTTGQTLTGFTLTYDGEQWRDSGVGTPETMAFGYSLTADSTTWGTGGAFTNIAALSWNAPVATTTAGAVVGNTAGKVADISATIKNINWDPGTDLWLRWEDLQRNVSDDGMAIDNVRFLADIFPVPTWTGAIDANWNNTQNWNTGAVPVSGDTVIFDSAGNGNTTISLGGTRPVGSIQFTSGAAAYTLGSSSEQFDVDAAGAITVANGVTTPQAINAKINALGDLFLTNNSTDANAGLTIGSNVTNNSSVTVAGAGTVTVNGTISGTGTVTSTSSGTLETNAQHTYSGNTSISVPTTVQPVIRVGASTVGDPGSVTSGPFGTGPVNISGATSPIIQPTGSDITIANDLTLNAGFFTATAPASVDPTVRSLTFTGPITTVGNRVITNNILSGGTLVLGSASSPSTLSLGGSLALQTQSTISGTSGGVIIVNDQISGAGGINAQNGATVYITNNNTNTAESNVQNSATGLPTTGTMIVNNVPVNSTDAGLAGGVAVRTGTLAGTGTIAGNSRMLNSNNGPSHLAPGNGAGTANGPGRLTFYNDLTLSSNACTACNVDIEIGGLTPGTEYDQVVVGGTLTIGDPTARGTLNVTLINGFTTPTTNTTFPIMTAASRVGEFQFLNPPDASWNVAYLPYAVALVAGMPGDLNTDSVVDAGDYVFWRKHNRPQIEYDLWRQNFGNPPGAGSGLGDAPVPEPGTIALLGTALIALAYPRRRCYSSARFLN